ncbi:MAG: hypothetical protein DMF35_01080 [Verrucomicrobia bacterium]|nr:MAG: hypothetical protein DMF35_01080 [Verrucomicrobiota bacterium]
MWSVAQVSFHLSNPRNSAPAKLQRIYPISLLKYAHLAIACHAGGPSRTGTSVGGPILPAND